MQLVKECQTLMDSKSVGKLLEVSYKENISPKDENTVVYVGWTKIESLLL